ncbi:hypothetical protein EVA_17699 [gut metagenome]|uniref:Uncharacterized protein n=1 Tax=gut metagenome TaxID=749906 RepID=J9C301_9ZZZZ
MSRENPDFLKQFFFPLIFLEACQNGLFANYERSFYQHTVSS